MSIIIHASLLNPRLAAIVMDILFFAEAEERGREERVMDFLMIESS
jgi:hypothetical protein